MNRKELRAIANNKPQDNKLGDKAPLVVRIGKRDKYTGYYEVILPNGAVLKNGVKMFNSSVPEGTEVEGKLSPNGQLFYLDYVDSNYPEILPDDEQIFDEIEIKIVLILCIDITKSIETAGVTKALEFLKRTEKDENNLDVEVGFLIDNPSAEVGYVAFGDDWCSVLEPTNSQDIIDDLTNQIDIYNGEYSTGFWGSEGTDLPENGIDAINKALEILNIAIADEKYIYLVTDNPEYSRNTNDATDVYDLFLNTSKSKLYFDLTPTSPITIDGLEFVFSTSTNLPPNDDGSSPLTPLGFNLQIESSLYSSLYVNNNGNFTFDYNEPEYTPFPLATLPYLMFGGFFGDVDTRGTGTVTYGKGLMGTYPAFCAKYSFVGYYSSQTNKLNDFEMILTYISNKISCITFKYHQIQWETGTASGGSEGLGGNSARVGFSLGNGEGYEVNGSAVNGAFLDINLDTGLIHNKYNSVTNGVYHFYIVNGKIQVPKMQNIPEVLPEKAKYSDIFLPTENKIIYL